MPVPAVEIDKDKLVLLFYIFSLLTLTVSCVLNMYCKSPTLSLLLLKRRRQQRGSGYIVYWAKCSISAFWAYSCGPFYLELRAVRFSLKAYLNYPNELQSLFKSNRIETLSEKSNQTNKQSLLENFCAV